MRVWGQYGRFLPSVLIFAILLTWVRPAAAQSAIPLAEYWQTIAQIRDDLRDAPEDSAVREAAVTTLSNINQIELADGRIQPINHNFLIRQLQNEDVTTKTLTTLLTAYLSSRQGWPDPALPTLDEAALDAILSQPEFNYAPEEPNFLQKIWQDIRQAIEDFWLRLFPEGSSFSLPLNDAVMIVAGVLVAIALAYALRGILGDLTADAALSAEEELGGEPLTADLALQKAQEFSTGGDFRTAVRYLYLSSLLLLEERGLLRYDRSLTNREYLRSVAHRPELAAILRDVIDVFDRVWYGFQTLSASEYDAYARRVETLKQQREAG
ncbi:MAG: DUF4129 domain-containing protein [Anaerolineales bacterium]|nr:DUF4129 domain-containing protein [Anaerolineales bacterium]MCB8937392.1 DUF4129 domain-containing protein [Ardenticatenaceae bacterium]